MMNLRVSETTVYYKLCDGWTENETTGRYEPTYGELKSVRMCVSPNKSKRIADGYGQLLAYDRIMSTTDRECEIDEQSVLWIDADTNGPHNFVVLRKSPSVTCVQYAIKRVNVSEN